MNSVSVYVVSIAGISILSVIIDLFLPSGSISSHIKSIFNFFIIFVVIAPLPNLLKMNVDFDNFFEGSEIIFQEDYLCQINQDKLLALESVIENKLEDKEFLNIDISLSADIFESQMQIYTVYVDLSDLVITANDKHIDIENEVTKVVLSFINIAKEDIVFFGK